MNLVASKQALTALVFAVGSLCISGVALAAASSTYSFTGVTNTNSTNTNLGKGSLFVEVIDLGFSSQNNANQVAFKFTNTSASSLTDVYFDDGALLGIASITDSGDSVAFTQLAKPENLPGAENLNPDFQTTAGFSLDSNAKGGGLPANGVSSGEWLTVTFDLQSTKTYSSVLSALALPNNGGTGDLRIGVHVQSFPSNGGSESFVNVASPVPEAQTVAMMLAGLGLVGPIGVRRRKV